MTVHSPSLSAVILAGGHSRRMGQDKALLTTPNGRPLLHQIAQTAQQITPHVAIVTAWPERYRPILPSGIQIICESCPEAFGNSSSGSSSVFSSESGGNSLPAASGVGPLSGFAQGWSQLQGDWCLLLACDLPYLEPAPLSQWWHWLRAHPWANPSAPVASLAPGIKGWEPLCGYYHRNCLAALQHYLRGSTNAHSFQAWLTTISVEPYHYLPPEMLFNCNTPQDWEKVQQTPLSPKNSESKTSKLKNL